MLSDRVKDLLHTHQLVVVIGARGTGKTYCADRLGRSWQELGLHVLRLDAATAEDPRDLELPLAEALGCDANDLTARFMPEDRVVRVIVDRSEHLHDRGWLGELQERWRGLLSDQDSRGRLSMVLLGRPVFRQIAGGDSSPLLNAGPVITASPLTAEEMVESFDVDEACGCAVRKMTGGHPLLTEMLVDAIDRSETNIGGAIGSFVRDNRRYVVQLLQDHPLAGQSVLSDLLVNRTPAHQGPLIRRHFGKAHADGIEAIDDLLASGLVDRTEDGHCHVSANLLRSVDGLQGLLGAPAITAPAYDQKVMGDAARVVFVAENKLRELVSDNLADVDPTWWISEVPPELSGDAQARRTAEGEVLSIDDTNLHPIMYLSLGELFDLVFTKKNWNAVFRTVFPIGKAAVEDCARRFGALRNRLAHNRPLSRRQFEDLEEIARRLGLSE